MKQRKAALEKIKKQLLEKRERISKTLELQLKEKKPTGDVRDSGDEAMSVSLEKLRSNVEQKEINEVHLIDDALERIEKGEFGYCTDCTEQISGARLTHYPYAARCITCQEAFESNE